MIGIEETGVDYNEFARRVASTASFLATHHGIAPGKRVALFAANSTNYLEALFAIWWAGAAAVPINAKLHPREAAWILDNADVAICFCAATSAAGLASFTEVASPAYVPLDGEGFAAMREVEPLEMPVPMLADDLAWLFYTSGTTGRPKGVMITCGNLQTMALSYLACVDTVEAEDTAFYAAPMSHGAGLYCLQHVMKAARHAVPASGSFDPAEIFAAARSLDNLHMFAAPTMIRRLVAHAASNGETGEGIKTIVYGGGPMYLADIVEAVDVLGPRFAQIYGQGESPMTITALPKPFVADREHPRWRERLQSVGFAQPSVEISIRSQDVDLPAGQAGEICVRGPSVMAGYWQNSEATAETIVDGWLHTGDIGMLDEDGFLTLMDRSKDVIISGGSNVYPREVEEVLLSHRLVSEVSVIGMPDPEWGEIVVAVIVAANGEKIATEELDSHCRNAIASFKKPKAYRFIESLPKNNYGKVLKTALREMLKKETGSQK